VEHHGREQGQGQHAADEAIEAKEAQTQIRTNAQAHAMGYIVEHAVPSRKTWPFGQIQ
jgi:hypothetical protein